MSENMTPGHPGPEPQSHAQTPVQPAQADTPQPPSPVNPGYPPVRRGGMGGMFGCALILAVLWIPLLVLVWYVWSSWNGGGQNQITFQSAPLVNKIRDMGELVTLRYEIQRILVAEKDTLKKWFSAFRVPMSQQKIALIAHLEADFLFDLQALDPDKDIRIEEKNGSRTVRITLPPPTLVVRLNNQKTRVYEHSKGMLTDLLNREDPNFESWLRQRAEEEMKVEMMNGEGPERARRNAEQLLFHLYRHLGIQDVRIDIRRKGPSDRVRTKE